MASTHQRTRVRLTGLVLVAFFSWLLGMYLAFGSSEKADLIIPRVSIAGIPVGGLRPSEAVAFVRKGLQAKVERPIHIVWNGGEHFIYPAEDGITADLEAMVKEALAVGRSGNVLHRSRDRYRAAIKGVDIPLQVTASSRFDRLLEDLGRSINRPAKDAGFSLLSDGTIKLMPSRDGLEIDLPALRKAVLATLLELDREVVAPMQVTQPVYATAQARTWGIKHVVARAETRFNTGDSNRAHNLRLAAEALDGAVLAPHEVFSFNQRVGPRLSKNGYKEAPVVVGGELVPDIGGGVCQVSSTLYNAVLLGGLRIRSRSPHSIPSTYVPLGLDAAVAYDYIDFRFINNTENHLYVHATTSGNRLIVALLGAAPADLARLVSKVESVKSMPVQQIRDPALPAGKTVVAQKGSKGYTVSVWRVRNAASGEKWELVSRSTYKAREQITRVGTGAAVGADTAQEAAARTVDAPGGNSQG